MKSKTTTYTLTEIQSDNKTVMCNIKGTVYFGYVRGFKNDFLTVSVKYDSGLYLEAEFAKNTVLNAVNNNKTLIF